MSSDKDYQESINLSPVKPQMDMQLPKPAIRRLCNDKSCQSTRCYKKMNYDKKLSILYIKI